MLSQSSLLYPFTPVPVTSVYLHLWPLNLAFIGGIVMPMADRDLLTVITLIRDLTRIRHALLRALHLLSLPWLHSITGLRCMCEMHVRSLSQQMGRAHPHTVLLMRRCVLLASCVARL